MKKRKAQKLKPVKAWATINDSGIITHICSPQLTKGFAEILLDPGEKIVRGTFTVED